MNNINSHHDRIFRRKYDLWNQGIIMIKMLVALTVPGAVFWAVEWNRLAILFFVIAGLIFLALMGLAIVDAYRDGRLDDFLICTDDKEDMNM